MRGVNKAILVATLGKDPEIRYMPNGDAVANFPVATSEQWKDKQTGEKRESTEWHNVVIYRKLAEIAGEYLKKGSQVYLEGKIKTRKWQDKEGKDRYTTEIVADQMQMLGGGNSSGNQSDIKKEDKPQSGANGPAPSFDDFDDDIPFAPAHYMIGG